MRRRGALLLASCASACVAGGLEVSIGAADDVVVPEGAELHARAEAWVLQPHPGSPQGGAALRSEDATCLATGDCGFTVTGTGDVDGAQAWLVYAWIDVDGDDLPPDGTAPTEPFPDWFPEPHDPQGTATALVHEGAVVSTSVVIEAP